MARLLLTLNPGSLGGVVTGVTRDACLHRTGMVKSLILVVTGMVEYLNTEDSKTTHAGYRNIKQAKLYWLQKL